MNKRVAIVTDIVNALKAIKASGGYSADMPASSVYPWRTSIVPDDKGELFSVKDTGYAYDGDGTKEMLSIEIVIACQKAVSNYSYITNRIYDVNKCMLANESTWRAKYGYFSIIPEGDEIDIYKEESEIAEATIRFSIIINECEKFEVDTTSY